MMLAYGPVPLLWAGSLHPGVVLEFGLVFSVSGLLALWMGAVSVPWLNDVLAKVGEQGYVCAHQRRLWRVLAITLGLTLPLLWLAYPLYATGFGSAGHPGLFAIYTSVMLLAQGARHLSLATSQCAAAMRLEKLIHPAAIAEAVVALLLMHCWQHWTHGAGFIAALAVAFGLRGVLSLSLETRLITRAWASQPSHTLSS
jgi:hypothetical protein